MTLLLNILWSTVVIIPFFASTVMAAGNKADILAKINSLSDDDTVKTTLHIDLFYIYLSSPTPDSALSIAHKGLKLAKRQKFERAAGTLYMNLGLYYDSKAEYSRSIEYFLLSKAQYEKTDYGQGIARAYYYISRVFEALNDSLTRNYYRNLSIKTSEGYANTELAILRDMSYVSDYIKKGNYDSAKYVLGEIKKNVTIKKDTLALGWYYIRLAEFRSHQLDYESALEAYYSALKYFEIKNDNYGYYFTKYKIGEILAHTPGKEEEAKVYYLTLVAEKSGINAVRDRFSNQANFYLAQLFQKERDYKSAYEHLKKFIEGNNLKKSNRDSIQLKNLIFQTELIQKEGELQSIQAENVLSKLNLENEKQNSKISILTAVVLVFVLLIIIIISYYHYRTNRWLSKTNKEILERNEQLKHANEEIRGLINVLSHDLKAPFGRIKGLMNILRTHPSSISPAELDAVTLHINQAVSQGLSLITELLEVHKIEEGNTAEKAPDSISWTPFFETIFKTARQHADQKSIIFTYTFTTEVEASKTNRLHLERITDNLISNSLKFTPPGKSVRMAVTISSHSLEMVFEDEGPGIKPEEEHLLFKKFTTLSAKPTGDESSSGLGLYSVKLMVEALNGHITYNQKLPEGSIFKVQIPLSE